jgi:hypothetical protein
MTDDRPARSTARTVAGIVALVILLNLLVRVVGLPEIDLPSVSPPMWLQAFLKLKNAAILGLVLLVVIGKVREERRRESA